MKTPQPPVVIDPVRADITAKYGTVALIAYVGAGILWALALRPSEVAFWLILLVGVLTGLPQWLRGRTLGPVPLRPAVPEEQVPQLQPISPEPPSRVPEPSDRCEICNRRLTNPDSQLARVGTECIKTHGPQYKYVSNPAHADWRAELSRAQVALAAARVEAKAEHARAMECYQRDFAVWHQQYLRPETQALLRRRKRHQTTAAYGAVLAASAYAIASMVM